MAGEGEIRDGAALYSLEAPFRAQDAATVPVRFTQAEGAPDVRRLTLVVDENPAPVAAEFTFGAGDAAVDLETRMRVDAYSNVRAIVETVDGDALHDRPLRARLRRLLGARPPRTPRRRWRRSGR